MLFKTGSIMLLRSLLLLSALLCLTPVQAQPRVVASILPIHSLTEAIMQGIAEPELLIPAQASPHDWSLRPSQRRALQGADLIIWVGSSLETFMPHILQGTPDSVRDLELTSLPGLELIRKEGHDHDHEETHIDPHIWLDPQQAIIVASGIARALGEIDPQHIALYQQNLDSLVARLNRLDRNLREATTPLRSVPFVVYHDAYGYFIRRYGLNQVGQVTLSAHQQPGARHLRELRQQLMDGSVRCLFTEPQFQPAIVGNLIEDTDVRLAELDPIGSTLKPGPEAYFQLMDELAGSLTGCLAH
jgi:zinc transport system substrate-binding protein